MRRLTRERPVIDRTACSWLIARFIDTEAEFLLAPPDPGKALAKDASVILREVTEVDFTQIGDGCSFDTFVVTYGLQGDAALVTIAAIVRGAKTDRHDLTPESAGLLAISLGMRDLMPDDRKLLQHSFVIYDALYAWAKTRETEAHSGRHGSTSKGTNKASLKLVPPSDPRA